MSKRKKPSKKREWRVIAEGVHRREPDIDLLAKALLDFVLESRSSAASEGSDEVDDLGLDDLSRRRPLRSPAASLEETGGADDAA